MNGYFGKNFGDLSEFLQARLTTKCSQSFRFFEMKKLTLLEAFVLLAGEKCCVLFCIIETKLTMKFLHLFVISFPLSLSEIAGVSQYIRHLNYLVG